MSWNWFIFVSELVCVPRGQITGQQLPTKQTKHDSHSISLEWRHDNRYKWCQAASMTDYPVSCQFARRLHMLCQTEWHSDSRVCREPIWMPMVSLLYSITLCNQYLLHNNTLKQTKALSLLYQFIMYIVPMFALWYLKVWNTLKGNSTNLVDWGNLWSWEKILET